jgi:putative membrane-bound dehydrogenase-like protein
MVTGCFIKKLVFSLMVVSLASCKEEPRYPEAVPPSEALKTLNIIDGYKVELFASEPHVFDPVSMEFDENGNCYVTLMPDAPYTPAPGEGKSEIRVLRDNNNDGLIDESIVFADKLSEATSILPWKGGLLVTAAPDIFYMKDTTGDFKADIKQKLFTGFFKNNYETQISNLQFSVDNWIYANNRGQEGDISSEVYEKGKSLSVRGGDFRFRLDKGLFENEIGPGQFGQDIDFFNNRYFTENSIPIQQAIIPWRYNHRHAYLPSVRAIRNISDHDNIMFQESETPYWRAERTNKRNREFKEKKLNRVEYERGRFTGCSGGTIYSGDAMPELAGHFFTAECSGNLVHRDIINQRKDSVYFTAKRADDEQSREFIFSRDTWFRPVNFTNAPDGYLYLLDFYRQHIETPVSIPDELKADMDFKKGSDKGRIFRIMPAGAQFKAAKPNLGKMSSEELVKLLAHSNEWYAITAHRLLVERQDKSVTPALTEMTKHNSDKARLHALYVIEALDALNAPLIKKMLSDPSSGIRINAAILAERFPECYADLVNLSKDSIAKVVLQATLSIGEFKKQDNVPVFVNVLEKYGRDRYFHMAVLSTDEGSSPKLFKALLSSPVAADSLKLSRLFLEDLGYVMGSRFNRAELNELVTVLKGNSVNNTTEEPLLKGLKKGLDASKNTSAAQKAGLKALSNTRGKALKDGLVSFLSS